MADAQDGAAQLEAHENSFHGFVAMMKWGTLFVAIIAAFVVFLIAK